MPITCLKIREKYDLYLTTLLVGNNLVNCGVEFERHGDGTFAYTREGAHSRKRILFHKDITGKEITSKLYEYAKTFDNIEIIENAGFSPLKNDPGMIQVAKEPSPRTKCIFSVAVL